MSVVSRIFLCLVAWMALLSAAAASDVVTTPRLEARLVAERTGGPAAGGTIALGLSQVMQPGWHTYWRNPGESGEPTTLSWTLPQGITASEINWPHPERIPFGELANYGYSNRVLLPVDITVPAGLVPGSSVSFRVEATWLACKDICVPENATLELTLPVIEGEPPVNPQWQQAFAGAREAQPLKGGPFTARFDLRQGAVVLYFEPPAGSRVDPEGILFFPFTRGLIKASAPQLPQAAGEGFAMRVPPGWRLRDPAQIEATKAIDGVLVVPARDGSPARAFELSLARGPVPETATAPAAASTSFLEAILFAILGGVILNMMPCVFPILSMKALSLVHSSQKDRPWVDGLVYLAGVMVTFAGLAGVLLWLRSLGEDVGWGFQLQSPLSVAILAYVLALVGFSLSGLFTLGTSLQGTGQGLAGKSGLVGTFFTGVLAVVVAAPCTAPFMGVAMSFAFTQSAPVTMAVFLALGFGLALPWVVFSAVPALVRLLPRPGDWMERFRQFLAFPMYAAVAWLVWVLSQQVDPEGLFRVMIGLVLLALGAWAFGNLQQRASLTGFILFIGGLTGAAALLAMPFAAPRAVQAAASGEEGASSHAFSEPYTATRLEALRAEGKPVFVNLTAAWCVSCLYNERVALSTEAVRNAFNQTGTVYLVGDWTNRNAEISALLRQYGRDGVPLYLYFPAGGGDPIVLPQLLTESIVINAVRSEK
ncbi:MAG: protein-disulfide reductase DsbD family protein [Alphaproteobacteria bacterium]